MRRSQRRGCPEGLVRLLVLAASFSTPTWGFNHPTVQCRRHITWPGREPSYVSGPNSIQGLPQRHARPLWGYRASDASKQSEEVMDISGDGGVTKRIIRPGYGFQQGAPPQYSYVKVAFVMKTEAGQVIADRLNKPMEFMIGLENPEVIRGWELAIPTMQTNEIAEVVCQSGYAFGSEGYQDKIPGGATIVSRIQLLNWRSLKSSASTNITDTEELSRKWREELDEGISPINAWANDRPQPDTAAPKQASSQPAQQQPQQAYQPSTLNDVAPVSMPPNPSGGGGLEVDVNSPPYEEMTEAGLRRVDLNDVTQRKKLNPQQVVVGKAPQYRWKEKQEWLELVMPVPVDVAKKDVLIHMTPRKLFLGYKDKEGKEKWVIGGDLYGPIDLQASFWVLAKDDGGDDELTQGQTCIEVRLEKKEPLRRIWANVFKEEDEEDMLANLEQMERDGPKGRQ